MNHQYLPHKVCLLFDPALLWLQIVSSALIALAYALIPMAIRLVQMRCRESSGFCRQFLEKQNRIAALFICFILACGASHFLEIVVLFYPIYWVQGAEKLVTAVISLATAGLLLFWVFQKQK